MTKELIRLEAEIGTGVFPDIANKSAPFWIDSRNVIFSEQAVQPVPGLRKIIGGQQSDSVLGLIKTKISGAEQLFWGDSSKLYRTGLASISTETEGSGYGVNTIPHWSFAKWGTWMLATNGQDTPQIYKGTSFGNLTGINGFTWARFFVPITPHMVAISTSAGDDFFHYSDEDDVETWQPLANNQAGIQQIRDLDGPIACAFAINDSQIAVYTQNQMHAISYIGPPFIFGAKRLLTGIGAVGPRAIVARGRYHYGFGPQSIWVTDGTSFKAISDYAVSDYIWKDINEDKLHLVCGQYLDSENAVVFYYPSSGSSFNDKGIIYETLSGSWGILNYGRTASDQGTDRLEMYSADRFGNIWAQNSRTTPLGGTEDGIFVVQETIETGLGYGGGGYGQVGYGGSVSFG